MCRNSFPEALSRKNIWKVWTDSRVQIISITSEAQSNVVTPGDSCNAACRSCRCASVISQVALARDSTSCLCRVRIMSGCDEEASKLHNTSSSPDVNGHLRSTCSTSSILIISQVLCGNLHHAEHLHV